MPPWRSPWGDLVNVSRDHAPWCQRSGEKRAYAPYCGWIVAVSKHSQCVVFVYHWYLHLPCPPSLSSLPPGIQTRELDPMFVNLNTETTNLHCLSLITFSWLLPRSHDRQSSLYVVDSGHFPEVMIVSQVCMLLIVASALLTKWLASRFYHTRMLWWLKRSIPWYIFYKRFHKQGTCVNYFSFLLTAYFRVLQG